MLRVIHCTTSTTSTNRPLNLVVIQSNSYTLYMSERNRFEIKYWHYWISSIELKPLSPRPKNVAISANTNDGRSFWRDIVFHVVKYDYKLYEDIENVVVTCSVNDRDDCGIWDRNDILSIRDWPVKLNIGSTFIINNTIFRRNVSKKKKRYLFVFQLRFHNFNVK